MSEFSLKTQYICIEGLEGMGKTTITTKLADHLTEKGFKVLKTKEPGVDLLPVTVKLRDLMLNKEYEHDYNKLLDTLRDILKETDNLTENATHLLSEIVSSNFTKLEPIAREYISQAIRSIHMEKLIYPNIGKYDYIIQDRGIVSGLSYGVCCGNDTDFIKGLVMDVTQRSTMEEVYQIYTKVLYLKGDPIEGLKRAKSSKAEFKEGCAIENRKDVEIFLFQVELEMEEILENFDSATIETRKCDLEQVFEKIKQELKI
jgi:thymidylate kinase